MEVKVSVDGVPRVVCGVTEKTTCQEVVIALAQALGRPGRYTLKEKFKDFERSVTPSERLLESLEKYGQQAREVQLTLLHGGGPPLWERPSRAKGGRYQACPAQLRPDAGGRVRRGSGSLSLHRQSLPPILRLRQRAEQPLEEAKRPQRKSLTLMEEAWGWLGSLGRDEGRRSRCDKGTIKGAGEGNGSSLNISFAVAKERSKVSDERSRKSTDHQRISCCMGDQKLGRQKANTSDCEEREGKDGRYSTRHTDVCVRKTKAEDLLNPSGANKTEEARKLREVITRQQVTLQHLQDQMTSADGQICELEERERARLAEQETRQKIIEEETEQLQLWENELKAEKGYEKDLQTQFLEMKEKAVECKARLEEYKSRMRRLDLSGVQRTTPEEPEAAPTQALTTTTAERLRVPNKKLSQPRSSTAIEVNKDRKFPPRENCNLPHALVYPHQIKDVRPSGPRQLREWWKRWSEAQSTQPETKPKVVHRSEITIYMGTTRV